MVSSAAMHLAAVSLTVLVVLNSTFAAARSTGGTLQFEGAVVQPPCQLVVAARQVSAVCPEKNGLQRRSYSLQQAERGELQLPGVAAVRLNWLNPDKSLAILQVEYR